MKIKNAVESVNEARLWFANSWGRFGWLVLLFISVAWLPVLNAATVATGMSDYSPFTLVSITGTGFQPGETINNQVVQVAGPAPGTAYTPWTAQADTNGNFTTSWLVFSDDLIGTTLQLTSTGQSSGLSASATFTDSLTCPGLQTGVAPISPPSGGFGIDGDLLANSPVMGVGDWLPDSSGLGGVLDASGCPLNGLTTYHLIDVANSPVDNTFSAGKANDNPSAWAWAFGNVGSKVDLKHALIHTTKDAKGHVWVVVAATRESNNGDAYVDFEFLQNPLTVVTNAAGTGGTFSSAGPNGGRTINDFVLAITLTGGGTTPNLCVFRWNQVGVDTLGNRLYDYTNATSALPANSVFGAMNTAPVSIPNCYSNVVDTYGANDFGEVAVDVTAMIGGFDPCATASIGTIFVKTKQSQSPSAALADFITPQPIYQPLILGPAALAGPNQTKCAQGSSTTFTMAGAAQQGTLPLTSTNWTVVSGFATIDQPSSLTPTVTVYGAGTNVTLRLTVTDSGPCANGTQHSDVVLTVNPLPACSITGDDATFDGSLGNTYSGPAGLANYTWSVSGNSGVTINGGASAQSVKLDVAPNASLSSGSFTLSLVLADANGCSSTCQKVVSLESAPQGCLIQGPSVVCSGSTGHQYTLSMEPSSATSYNWSISGNGSFNPSPTSSASMVSVDAGAPGSFTVQVIITFNGGATMTCSFPVTVEQLALSLSSETDVTCYGGNNGFLTVSASAGTAPYSYSVDGVNFQASATFGGLPAGNYTVTVKDSSGCLSAIPVSIGQPPSAVSLTATATQPQCSTDTGSINASASGGAGTITYSKDGATFQATGLFSGLAAGNYTITAQDANGCTATMALTITVPSAITLSATATQPKCSTDTGSINASASGGTGTITYSKDGTTFQATGLFSGLAGGNYTITAKDANGCIATTPLTINPAPSVITLAATATQPKCSTDTGSINASASGGTGTITYSKDGTTFQATGLFSGLAAGNYTITAQDANGCSATTSVTINPAPSAITLAATATQPKCSTDTGSINASASGGTGTITYSKDSTTFQATGLFSGLAAGNYTITAKDANGCTATTALTIIVPSAITLSATATQPKCSTDTGSINASASGGTGTITYSKDGTTFQATGLFSSLAGGNYTITAKDANGCTATALQTINPAPSAIALAATATQPKCSTDTGSINASGSGGTGTITYSKDGTTFQATGLFSGLAAGNYTITGQDANGCTATTAVTINAAPSAITLAATATQPKCSTDTGSINASASGGTGTITYSKDGTTFQATGLFSGLAAGNYTITAQDANGCTATAPLTINAAPSAITLAATATQPKCSTDTGSINASASGGTGTITYSKDGTTFQATGLFSGLAAGNYTITAKDANGCTATAPLTINAAPSAITLAATATQPKCSTDTGSINATASGGTGTITYSKDGTTFQATGLFSGLAAGNYTITAQDANGCTATTSVSINAAPSAITLAATATQSLCTADTGSISASASGGTGTITYSKDGTTFQPTGLFSGLAAGIYTITAKDSNGCMATTQATVSTPAAITLSATATQPKCSTDTGSINASASGGIGTITYSKDGTTFQATGLFSGLAGGNYTITAKDANGCTASMLLTINAAPPAITLTATATQPKCSTDTGSISAKASGGTGTTTYSKDGITFQATGSFTSLAAGNYTITAKDANGCTAAAQVTINGAPPAITLTATATQPKCSTDTGSINASASGGTGTISYSKDGTTFQATGSFTGLAAGNYTITAKDANGCTATTPLTINAAPPPITLTATVTQPNSSTPTGSINASASGGTGTITYSKDGTTFQATGLFSGLAAGNYTITAKDANGCTATTTVLIDPPAGSMALNLTIVQPKCSSDTGIITAAASSGTAPYTYSLNGITFQTSGTFSGLQPNTYTVTAKDFNGHTCAQTATILRPPAISCAISGLSDVQAGSTGNTFTATAGGGTPPYSFAWSCNNSAWTITGTTSDSQSTTLTYGAPACDSSTSFTVTTTDANGCTAVCTVTVSCTPPGTVTDSGLCTFPSPFRLIFTHDPSETPCPDPGETDGSDTHKTHGSDTRETHGPATRKTHGSDARETHSHEPTGTRCYKLTASNPGQFFYNMTYQGTPGEKTATFYITLPYPFITHGAEPIHAYDSVTIHNNDGEDGETCLTPGDTIYVSGDHVTLASYGPNPVVGVTTYTFAETVPLSPLGFAYLNIHLDYGLKKFGGYTPGGTSGKDAVACFSSSVIPIPDFVANNLFYTFGYRVGSGVVNTLSRVQSTNDFNGGNSPPDGHGTDDSGEDSRKDVHGDEY